jgi:hypothetical protein
VAPGTPEAMPDPTNETLRELLRWEPPHGVVSAYVAIDPAHRGEGWRIELRNQLRELDRESLDHDARMAIDATARRILDRFPPDSPLPHGRTHVGFVEIAAKAGREEWFSLQLDGPETQVTHGARPAVGALLAILDEGAPRGVALVSGERVRLLRWELGRLTELESWEIEVFSLDWRERKSQRPGDPARVQGAASSGRDQYGQRMEHNRERFLKEAGRLAVERLEPRDAEILAFGDAEHVREFAAGGGERVRACGQLNLVSAPVAELEMHVGAVITGLNRRRELELAQRIKAEAAGGSRAAAGAEETLQALAEGRVEHLLFDARAPLSVELPEGIERDGLTPGERMVELALATSARVTPADGEAADALAEVGGVAALLRY